MSALRQIRDNVAGLWSLVVGLKVTGTCFVKDQVTVHYPRNEVDNLESFRGPIELVASPDDPARPRCIACMTCASICPHECITVVRKKPAKTESETDKKESGSDNAGTKKKISKGPSLFIYDYTRCCLCGFCVENCPAHSIRFSNRGYLAGFDKNAFVFDLLEKFGEEKRSQKSKVGGRRSGKTESSNQYPASSNQHSGSSTWKS